MKRPLSRRDFLKLGGLALGSLAYSPLFPRQPDQDQGLVVRVATKQVDVRSLPDDQSPIVGNRFRDQLLHVYEQLNPPNAPKFYNTLWYRVWGGYVHSGHLQIVETRLNEPLPYIMPGGQLAELTVPFSRAYQYNKYDGWFPWRGSMLYYSSTHWLTGIEAGPDGRAWYKVTSELSASEFYFVQAEHLRIIPLEEFTPLSIGIPPEKKRIEISLREQKLRLFENDLQVLEARISSGIPNHEQDQTQYPTATPVGRFNIYSKLPSKHMGSVAGGPEVEENGGFALPGVPWTCFFKSQGGYALHGTYWHTNFGLQMSHGCVNLRNEDAKFIFRWTTPVFDPYKVKEHADWEVNGNGTLVIISSRS